MAGEAFGIRADLKAELAQLGQTMHPDAAIRFLPPPTPGATDIVVLERVVKGVEPDYCIHGYVHCIHCHELCWLGSATEKIVVAGEASPLCLQCARELVPRDRTIVQRVVGNHRRADGPHVD